jgi:AraC family transcriptional activator of mtrCDE
MDWLSQLLEMMPVRGSLDLRCSYGAPWRIEQPASEVGEIAYHVVIGGSAILEDSAGGASQRLGTGDLLMLPNASDHVLHDEGSDLALPARNRDGLNITFSENEGAGERLELLCGRFILTPVHHRLIQDYLPSRVIVPAATQSAAKTSAAAAQLAGLVSLMRAESEEENLGGRALLNGLSAAMFALALRRASETKAAPASLLTLAGHPRLAPAIAAMFQAPAQPCTLPELAALCGMSRATFARQFQGKLGKSASDLLLDIRMTLAANELKKPDASTADVAETIGYQSEAAFQRVFKNWMGVSPSQWRKGVFSGLKEPLAGRL